MNAGPDCPAAYADFRYLTDARTPPRGARPAPGRRAGQRAALDARQPLGRPVSADEVTAAGGHLASPAAASVTGTALVVDGGMQGLRLRPAR